MEAIITPHPEPAGKKEKPHRPNLKTCEAESDAARPGFGLGSGVGLSGMTSD
jgi:hypothetical protein